MLIDELLPSPDVQARYALRVPAPAEAAYAAIRTANLNHWGAAKVLFGLRALPSQLFGVRRPFRELRAMVLEPLTLDTLLRNGFTLLKERPGAELVMGSTGRFWELTAEMAPVGVDEFTRFAAPNAAQLAWNFAVAPAGPRECMLSTETRVRCTDEESRRRFRAYWTVIRPFSGLIRREMLSAVRASARNPR